MRNLEEFFLEPACGLNLEKSEKERKKGCSKPQPGSASGGCAFDGAQITLLPIADAVHIVHGPIACAGNSWDNRGTRSSISDYYRMGFTTDMKAMDVIHGGERKLYNAIIEAVKKYNPPAVFVYQTCVPAMIGDDIVSVCKRASEELGLPVIPVESPGFVGSKNLGNKLAGDALFKYVIGTKEPEYTTPYDINLLGEYNIAGELWQVIPLFRELGIRVLACITGDANFYSVATAHRAKVNMVVCSKALLSLARKMEEKYGIPYFEGSFYGIKNTSDALRNIAKLLGDQELIEKTERLIAQKEEETRRKLEPYIEKLRGKRVLINTGGVKSWSMVSQVQELGMVVVGTSSKKSTKEDKERMLSLLGDEGKLIDDPNPKELVKLFRELKVDVLMAGGRSKFVAIKEGIPFLDTNQERIKPYAGYDGMIILAQELVRTIYSPVFELYKEAPPWQY
ncbi:nitrogenase iron-molybdenum cofactor biosynthesis protein NifE [Thermocrinis sp.]|jgi:nitrogenase molybdenum-cofactor synthesis protein NifE|uniref:nitrogenase iron-molybdenum cofactor biosynthesis protein NifE n=1 Tax=Thermocrinis sp. TaxID=2024383 RepID=UPI003C0A020C